MEPRAERVVDPERAAFEHEHQECGLQGVLGFMVIPEDTPAGAQHHGAVPLDQRRKRQLGRLVAAGREPFQELPVGQPGGNTVAEQRADLRVDRPAP